MAGADAGRLEVLTPEQRATYNRDGYLLLENWISKDVIAACHAEIARFREESRGLSESNDRIDLEDSHSPQDPRLRRIKLPHRLSPCFEELMRNDRLLAPVRDLIGPNLRLHTSKLNLKPAGFGAAVDWHQDFAFYPHTNDDLLAVGVMLNDVGPENGPLMFFPGTHRGPVCDHHVGGYFAGTLNLAASGLELADAVTITAPAGSMTLHHVRLVHGSGVNRSGRDREILFYEIAAADAFPVMGAMSQLPSMAEYDSRLLCGEATLQPRLAPVPLRIPLPLPEIRGSIFEIQKASTAKGFETAPTGLAAKDEGTSS